MTDPLYMDSIGSCYEYEFEAEVTGVYEENAAIILDRTAFYPEGGGQPSDTGSISWDGKTSKVTRVKKGKEIFHHLEGTLPKVGQKVKGILDEERRYAHMRMHTAQHLLSAVIWERYKAATVGNQIHSTHSHIDFHPASFTMDELKDVEREVNSLIEKDIPVTLSFMSRNDLQVKIEQERVDLSRLPISVKTLRTVMIGGEGDIDMCPCAGTHVRSTGELGRMEIVKRKSKGSGKIRVQYILD